MAVVGAVVGVNLVAPAIADAQETRIRAERLTIIDGNGVDRVLLRTIPGISAGMAVLAQDGTTSRASMNTGAGMSTGGTLADAAGFELYLVDGTRVGRLGTHNSVVDGPGTVNLFLSDSQGNKRIVLLVDDDGNPSIQFLDANGNVTWSAQ
jgi:hypothetical protein